MSRWRAVVDAKRYAAPEHGEDAAKLRRAPGAAAVGQAARRTRSRRRKESFPRRSGDSCEGGDLKGTEETGSRSGEDGDSSPPSSGSDPERPPSTQPSSDSSRPAETEAPKPPTPDEALKAAITAAVAVGDYTRAEALIAVLKATPKPAPVLSLTKGGAR